MKEGKERMKNGKGRKKKKKKKKDLARLLAWHLWLGYLLRWLRHRPKRKKKKKKKEEKKEGKKKKEDKKEERRRTCSVLQDLVLAIEGLD